MRYPHTAIFDVEANNTNISFDYNLREGNKIRIYPFENVDHSGMPLIYFAPLKFILDVHLGKLAKTLRLLGLNASFDTDWDDEIISRSNERYRAP